MSAPPRRCRLYWVHDPQARAWWSGAYTISPVGAANHYLWRLTYHGIELDSGNSVNHLKRLAVTYERELHNDPR